MATYVPTSTAEYDLNGACIDPKSGNGLGPWTSQTKIEKNIQERFCLDDESYTEDAGESSEDY